MIRAVRTEDNILVAEKEREALNDVGFYIPQHLTASSCRENMTNQQDRAGLAPQEFIGLKKLYERLAEPADVIDEFRRLPLHFACQNCLNPEAAGVYMCARMKVSVDLFVYVNVRACVRARACMRGSVCVFLCARAFVRACMFACIRGVCVFVCARACVRASMCACVHVCTNITSTPPRSHGASSFTRTHENDINSPLQSWCEMCYSHFEEEHECWTQREGLHFTLRA